MPKKLLLTNLALGQTEIRPDRGYRCCPTPEEGRLSFNSTRLG